VNFTYIKMHGAIIKIPRYSLRVCFLSLFTEFVIASFSVASQSSSYNGNYSHDNVSITVVK